VARFGGDEFAILMTKVTDPAAAGRLARGSATCSQHRS
jgi:GGDEF domain-containing protein